MCASVRATALVEALLSPPGNYAASFRATAMVEALQSSLGILGPCGNGTLLYNPPRNNDVVSILLIVHNSLATPNTGTGSTISIVHEEGRNKQTNYETSKDI